MIYITANYNNRLLRSDINFPNTSSCHLHVLYWRFLYFSLKVSLVMGLNEMVEWDME